MSLYKDWQDYTKNVPDYETFWDDYLEKEKVAYEEILSDPEKVVSGTVAELSERFNMEQKVFIGFMEGINTSLVKEVDVEKLDPDSKVELRTDLEKLYYNMLAAKADWLYGLEQWGGLLSDERRKEITKEFKRSNIAVNEKVAGRNDPCPCGSGKKYKKCCGK